MKLEWIPLNSRIASPSEANVICLGNFDGVHLGHRALFSEAIALRNEAFPRSACGAFCFRTLPADTLFENPPGHLCTAAEKQAYFRDCGLDFLVLAEFEELRDLSPEDFIKDVLIDSLSCAAAVCGFNHRFGKGGRGNADTFLRFPEIRTRVVDEVRSEGDTVSSSRIRALIAEGDVACAARLLTRPYCITAPVLHGKALGRRLGAPTINQSFPRGMQIPRHGVYVTSCEIGGEIYRGVTNVGVRPTVDAGEEVNCETYLLDFEGSLYGESVTVSFLSFLRAEQKFETQTALAAQIARDIDAAQNLKLSDLASS